MKCLANIEENQIILSVENIETEMKTIINGKEYVFTNEVRNNSSIRQSFNELAKKTFGIDFEDWYQNGFWEEDYIPYVLMDGDTVVSNISVNIIHTNYGNEERLFIQLGTVMTDERYRNQGMSRWLIQKILEEWKEKCDAFYLYANDKVLDFYPKFGFVKEQEYQASGMVTPMKAEIRKLDMTSGEERKLLHDKYDLSNPFSDLTMENNNGLIMFYCSQFMKENVYYIHQYDVVVVAEYDADKLICYDVFGNTNATLQEILSVMAKEDTKVSILGFTPKDKDAFTFKEVNVEGLTLFWWSEKENIFSNDAMVMFPLLSHA
jgi:predicted GNAT family N-acyltransferase